MAKIIGNALPDMPWEDRPANCTEPVWRYSKNPIITRDAVPFSNSIFNSAAVPFKGKYAGVFRVDNRRRWMTIHAGFSDNGIDWNISPEPINFTREPEGMGKFEWGYDPRVCELEGRYYVSWCNGYHEQYPTIGLAVTDDFVHFEELENALLPYNRNGVLFPRRIDGEYYLLSRPSDNGHTPFGDIFISRSKDLEYWGKHRFVMKANECWQGTKIGAGPTPIETDEGWLLIYHGVLTSCNGFVYSFGAALLDLEQPWKVIGRSKYYLMAPRELYECVGDVPNVVFPCAALNDAPTGRITIYYGCADTCTGLCFTTLDEVLAHIRRA